MNKVVALALTAALLLTSTVVYAAGNQELILHMDGKQITYKAPPVTIKLNGKVLKTDVPAVILEDRTLVPIRVISEGTGASVNWDGQKYEATVNTGDRTIKLTINSKDMYIDGERVSLDVPAKIINDRTMVPVRAVSEAFGLKVGWDQSTYTVLLDYPEGDILDMAYDSVGEAVILKTTGRLMYQTIFLQEPDRLVIDFPNTVFRSTVKGIDIDRGNMIRVRASQFEVKPNISRVVIDLASPSGYSIAYDQDTKQMRIRTVNAVKGVSFDDRQDRNRVIINSASRLEYQTMTLEKPDRIVVDLLNTYLEGTPGETIPVGKDGIKAIRYSQFEDNTVRAVIDLDAPLLYSIESRGEGIVIYLDGSPMEAVKYTETGWKTATLSIDTGREVEYNVVHDRDNKTLIVEISDNRVILEEGEIYVSNGIVDRIEVAPYDSIRGFAHVVLYLKDSLEYKVTSPGTTSNIGIELSGVPSMYQDMLIVIDPGHGGQDPGGTSKGIREKELNLDISFRLKALLEEMGFKTLMTRTDDSFVDLYRRAEIANEANADLFMSVHINAHPSASMYGVETLYYPSSKNEMDNRDNYTYARIIQQELVKALNTADRGLDPREKLVVTRETKMPSVIAELGFLTNSSDRSLLLTEAYRQKCAQALANGIKRYVEEVLIDR